MRTVETCSQTTASSKDAVLSHKHGQSISKAWTQWGTGNVLSSEALPGPLTKHRTKLAQGRERTALTLQTDVDNPQFNCSNDLVICMEYSDSVTRTTNDNMRLLFWTDNVVLILPVSSIQIRTLCTDTGLKNGWAWSCCSGATANNGTGAELCGLLNWNPTAQ